MGTAAVSVCSDLCNDRYGSVALLAAGVSGDARGVHAVAAAAARHELHPGGGRAAPRHSALRERKGARSRSLRDGVTTQSESRERYPGVVQSSPLGIE